MKKIQAVLVVLLMCIFLSACTAKQVEMEETAVDYPAAIMVNDTIYLLEGEPSPIEVEESAIIGYTSSYTDTFPEQNGETNFNRELKMPYAQVEGGIAVLYQNEWHLCVPKGNPNPESESENPYLNTTATQIQIICDKAEVWKVIEEMDGWGYAVTDLDGNGRLEIISSECHGTGLFTTNRIWEVNEAMDGLNLCEKEEMVSEADMCYVEAVPAYYDAEENRTYFVFRDDTRNGAAEHYQNTRALSLKENRLEDIILSGKSEIYEDATKSTITYYDSDGNEISEDEYGKIIDSYFKDFEKKEAHFKWITSVYVEDITNEELYDLLMDSYTSFKIQ